MDDAFFAALAVPGKLWVLWLLAAGAIACLVVGADRAVTGAARLARVLGLSPIVIGATVVSLGTTSPEASVSVTAALRGKPGLALGNGVGSIICDTALVFGLSCVLTRLPLDRFILRRQGVLKLATGTLLAVTLLLLAVGRGGFTGVVMPRWIGFSFLVLLAVYLYLSVRWARAHPQMVEAPSVDDGRRPWVRVLWNLVLCGVGLGVVVYSSGVLVGSVTALCKYYRVPPDVLAVTLVAFGTSVPELATAVASVIKGHPELLIGNVIGADILNVLFVIGASAAAAPLAVPTHFYTLHIPVMMGAIGLMGLWIFTSRDTFHRWQGVPLLLLYGVYYGLLLWKFRPQAV